MGWRMGLVVSCLIVLGLIVLGGCGTGTDPAPSSAKQCPDVLILGARGQSQRYHWLGHEVDGVARAITAALSGQSVKVRPVRYPARLTNAHDEYLHDVDDGHHRMAAAMRTAVQKCHQIRFVLVGFSEGAQAVHVTATAVPRTVRAHVTVVVMGDPIRNRGDLKSLYGKHLIDVCDPGDNVCNPPPGGRTGPISAAHTQAYENPATVQSIAQATVASLKRHLTD